jgi:hypothetical protein
MRPPSTPLCPRAYRPPKGGTSHLRTGGRAVQGGPHAQDQGIAVSVASFGDDLRERLLEAQRRQYK